jgi:hypothetical protein
MQPFAEKYFLYIVLNTQLIDLFFFFFILLNTHCSAVLFLHNLMEANPM